MISKLEKKIAFRYLRTNKKDGFLNIITIFSFIGISLGVAVLIIVMSVMNGFRSELIDKIIGFNAHAVIKPYEKAINTDVFSNKNLRLISKKLILSNSGEAVIINKDYTKGILLRGYAKKSFKRLKIVQNKNFNGNRDLNLKNPNKIDQAKKDLINIFPDEFIYTWSDLNRSLFSALKVERNVMFIILSLIIIVAAFNIISGLTILVNNKTREIAILKSIGVNNASIKKIFFLVGFIIGTSATIFGIVLGILFSRYIENIRKFLSEIFNLTLFPEEIYFLSNIPSQINITSLIVIALCSIISTCLVSIYPAIKASNLNPAKGLKHE